MTRTVKQLRLLPCAALCALACAGNQAPAPATAASASPPATQTADSAPDSAPGAEAAAQANLPAPEWLPLEAREMLSAGMQRHGEEMMLLLVSVMMLQHEDTELLAQQVASTPRLGRPAPGESGTLGSLLPARFFELQDELQARARAMADAARTKDDSRIVRAYGQLAETCVSCHSVYLNPDEHADLPGD